MKPTNIIFFIIFFLINLGLSGQQENLGFEAEEHPLNSVIERMPKISIDSTDKEITDHVEAMMHWMTEEFYKSNYAPILIYADKGLPLAKKSANKEHIHQVRSIVGNTLIRIKDTLGAKNLFLKSLDEAVKTNDSSLLLRFKSNISNIYYYTKGYKGRTIRAYLESIEIAEKLKDTLRLFKLHHNLCRAFNETKQPKKSEFHLKKTEHYLNLLGNPPHFAASHYHNIGRWHLLLNHPDEAITYFNKTIALCENTDFKDALLEGYDGYKDAMEMRGDYEGFYNISKTLEVYEEEKKTNEAKSIIESVSAKLNVERFKEQIKSKELEKKLLLEQADRKNILLILGFGAGICLIIVLCIFFMAYQKRKVLIRNLQEKNEQYIIEKQKSDELTKAKTKFFATVSHELRTPLYGVIGLSSILLENKDLKEHEKDLNSLKFSANYLLALINDLLQINKIESNSVKEEDSIFSLDTLIGNMVSTFEYIRVQHQNEINVNIDEDVPSLLKGNSVRLSQILMNLVGNACKFTEKGEINLLVSTFGTFEDKVKLQFVVQDTGPGIPTNKLDQIFNEFTQIDASSNEYQGTGLGLPIVKKLVEQAGGTINVESKLGQGTIFKFTLEIGAEITDSETITSPILDFKQLSNKKILIVEDNRINQTVTKRILEGEDVVCDIAQNGEVAINMVKESNFDLVLMDINMPVKNGIEATREIRFFNKFIPIIALTAVEIEEQKYQIFECGMNDIILKPYDIDQFKKTIILNLFPTEMGARRKMA